MLERLATRLARRERFTETRPRRAAVLVPLLGAGAELSLLLTRRSAALASHSGQVAFPGGLADDADEGPEGTALREAFEEIGLARADARVLGLLDDLPSYKNDMAVTPVVARLQPHLAPADFTPNKAEVARVFSIPMAELLRAERWREKQIEWRGQPLTQYYFDHDGETLWGLSAYATLMLVALAAPPGASGLPSLPWFQPAGRSVNSR